MRDIFIGMTIQAAVTGILTACGVITPTAGQQTIAAVFFCLIACAAGAIKWLAKSRAI